MNDRLARISLGLLLASLLLGTSATASGQESAAGNDERTFGTASPVVLTLSAMSFVGANPIDVANLEMGPPGQKFCQSTEGCVLALGVSLPAGAVVTGIELDACVGAGSQLLRASLTRFANSVGNLLVLVDTGDFSFVRPGCAKFLRNLPSPETIDNVHNYYVVQAFILSGGTNDTALRGVRVFYHLQVSPPPAAATFNDVPTSHPFFQFIQALVAAGITQGCSTTPPLYCPDALVTRKQMAAFFARALGLHWAP